MGQAGRSVGELRKQEHILLMVYISEEDVFIAIGSIQTVFHDKLSVLSVNMHKARNLRPLGFHNLAWIIKISLFSKAFIWINMPKG
jgi:hypothetical protein